MRAVIIASIVMPTIASGVAGATEPTVVFSGAEAEQPCHGATRGRLDRRPGRAFTFTPPDDGWVFLTAKRQGKERSASSSTSDRAMTRSLPGTRTGTGRSRRCVTWPRGSTASGWNAPAVPRG